MPSVKRKSNIQFTVAEVIAMTNGTKRYPRLLIRPRATPIICKEIMANSHTDRGLITFTELLAK
jgi:hypothetical protein